MDAETCEMLTRNASSSASIWPWGGALKMGSRARVAAINSPGILMRVTKKGFVGNSTNRSDVWTLGFH